MSIKTLTTLFFFIAAASSVVIKTDAQVQATLNVQASNDQRSFSVLRLANWVSAFGLSVQNNVSTGSVSNKKNVVYVRSSGGLLAAPSIEYGTYSSSSSFDLNGGTASTSSSSLYTAFRPVAVVQYVDNNNNGKYDIGEEYAVSGLGFRTYNVQITKSDNSVATSVYLVSYSSSDFGFRYSVQNRAILNQGARADEDGTKIDIWIRPSNNARSNGKVALLATYSAVQSDSSLGGSANNGNVTVNGNGNIKFSRNGDTTGLSWQGSAQTADQNGNSGSAKVTADVLTLSASASLTINGVRIVDASAILSLPKLLVFNFDSQNPSEIYWDPYLGPNSAGSVVVSVMAVIFALALVL